MSDRPNILWICTDQQRFDTIGALGNPVIRTPQLDRMVREGTSFTSAYTPSPVCMSARCSMVYGQYAANTGCYENMRMPTDRPTIMHALTEAGYRTHGVGKCHFNPDGRALWGFQSRDYHGDTLADDDYFRFMRENGYGHVIDSTGVRGEMYYIPQPAMMPADKHFTHWTADRAIAFMESQAQSREPWMCYVGFIQPHPPFAAPEPWNHLYRASLMPLPFVPPQYETQLTWVNHVQNRFKWRDAGIDLNLLRVMKAYYYACISFIDFQLGRMFATLEKTGQLDNTLILFTTDHGEHLGDRYCFGKRSMHDTSSRIPLLARLPGRFQAGARCDRPASLIDLVPTMLAVSGAKLPDGQPDGVDLSALANGQSDRQFIFSQHSIGPRGEYMVLNGRWKYVYSAADEREFLYDRVQDPLESRSCAYVGFRQDVRNEMRKVLLDHLRSTGHADLIDGDSFRKFGKLPLYDDPDRNLLVQDTPWGKPNLPGYSEDLEYRGGSLWEV